MNRDALVEILREACGEVLADTEVLCAYLFGSAASDRTHPTSDIDVALFTGRRRREPELPMTTELAIGEALQRRAAVDRELDVRCLDVAPLVLQAKVVREGILLYESDRSRRCVFESLLQRMYLDYRPTFDATTTRYFEAVRRRGLT